MARTVCIHADRPAGCIGRLAGACVTVRDYPDQLTMASGASRWSASSTASSGTSSESNSTSQPRYTLRLFSSSPARQAPSTAVEPIPHRAKQAGSTR